MASLQHMSAEEISELLDEYGIKHGPVVGESLRLFTLRPFLNQCSCQLTSQASTCLCEVKPLIMSQSTQFSAYLCLFFPHIYVFGTLFVHRQHQKSV